MRPASASRAFWRRCASVSATNGISCCAINARRTTSTTRSIRSSARSGAAPALSAANRPPTRLDKLETMIARAGLDTSEIAPYLASLLAIPTEGRYPALEMAPSEVKERTIAALIAMVVGLAKAVPLLMLLEDAHWIDPTSLELFGRLDRARAAPARAARGDVSAGIRRALGWPRACHRAVAQPLRTKSGRRDDRSHHCRARRCPPRCSIRSSPRPTACRCSSRN